VDWPGFFRVLKEESVDVDCAIEREAGHSRIDDVKRARPLIEEYLGLSPAT
jgi:hypothetical protein